MSADEFAFPGSLRCGAGMLAELPSLLEPGSRQLLVCDRGLVALGIQERISTLLDDAGMEHTVYAEVDPDPDIEVVERALALARRESCAGVIALGGGSAIDAAKALAARLAWPHSLREYGDGLAVPEPVAPLVALPTTAGTGSEATRVAVITDPERNEKMALRGEGLLPDAAVLDPELLTTLPANITAECGADALTHAIEAFLSREATEFTDALALTAVSTAAEVLPDFVADRANPDAGERMLMASHLAGRAFTHAGLGLVHSLAEPLGAFHHLRHGLTCALFLPTVMEFNRPVAEVKMAQLARAMEPEAEFANDADAAARAVAFVRELLAGLGLPADYAAAGIDFVLEPEMVDQVAPQFSTQCNPRRASRAEIEGLYLALDRERDADSV